MRSDQQLDQFNGLLWYKFHELLPELDHILLLLFQRNPSTDVLQRSRIILLVFNQNLEIKFMFVLLLSQLHSLIIMSQVLAYLDGCLNIKEIALKVAL